MDRNSIYSRSLSGIRWIYGYTVVPKIIAPVVQIILAKILVPADFGLIAIAALVISFEETIRERGFTAAFIQSSDDDASLINTVFWLSTGMGAGLYLIIFSIAPLLAEYFNNPDSIWVIRIMGLQIVLSSLNTCHRSSLIKNMAYNKLFNISLIPALVPAFITVPLAYIGLNVWALIIGSLASSFISTFTLWHYIPLRPSFKFNKITAKRILYFGSYCSLEGSLGWFYVWGDKAVVGHFISVAQLGIYHMASTIVTFVFGVAYSPLSISYPLMCGLKDDKAAMQSVLVRIFHVVSSVSFLIGIFIFFNVDMIPYVFGKKWEGIGLPLGILAITNSFSYIVSISIPDALRAIGRADVVAKFQSAKLLYTLPAFIIGAKYGGIVGFCYAKLVTVLIGFVLFLFLATMYLSLTWKDILKTLNPKIMAFIGTFIILFCLNNLILFHYHIIVTTIINCILATVVYFIVLMILDKKGLYELFRISKRLVTIK